MYFSVQEVVCCSHQSNRLGYAYFTALYEKCDSTGQMNDIRLPIINFNYILIYYNLITDWVSGVKSYSI